MGVVFDNSAIRFDVLRRRAYNQRWAEQEEGVIPLTAADMDFPCAKPIVDAIVEYAQAGYFSYTPKRGLPEFRRSLARYFNQRKKEPVPEELILPIDSAARAMSVIARAVLKPGDEAIVCDPVDYLFKTTMEAAGAKIVLFPMRVKDGRIDFSDLESYITPKTRMFGLCNPHNPLGLCYPLEDLDHILGLSEKYGFYIMNDEIWSDIVYSDARFHSILELGAQRNRRTLSVFGFSKSYGIAGLRVGCLYAADPDLFERAVAASEVDSTIGGISSLSQVAGMACLEQCGDWLAAFLAHLQGNRDYALERLNAMPGIRCRKSQATFALFPDMTGLGMGAEAFAELARQKYRVAVVPGGEKFFGPGSEGHVRICLATSRDVLKEGLDRLEQAAGAAAAAQQGSKTGKVG